ncbi:hypothetical protein GALMADRAFT_134169 [Galerina marginata CBS 339.88]|uniref:Uncharacterized protein n=1 Tax=Galerina marginata (strain CBS 339.88) TaxID=685588 RepID=A0A067THG8_GALM3|nr:hypothetical protein GALMADRAFT_134169 [Galerina marginata CBS 339.88]
MPQPQLRYHVIAHQLTKVPPELVHEIINDLPIVKILELISNHKIPYIEQCVCTQIYLKEIFSPSFLAEVKSYFVLYLRIRRLDSRFPHPILPRLEHDAYTFLKISPPVNIVAILKAAIIKHLEKYEHLFPLLRVYAPESIPEKAFWVTDSASDLQQIFENIDAAEMKLNSLKADQLRRMACLIQKYPMTMKTRENTSQEVRRNEQHLVDRLLYLSNHMKNGQILQNRFVGVSVFSKGRPFLVPYDRLLRLFLKTIDKFPPILNNKSRGSNRKYPHRYPSEIKTVLEGMSMVYPRDGESRDKEPDVLSRTVHTKYSIGKSDIAARLHQPAFWLDWDSVPIRDLPVAERLLPASDKELEWLEAFLFCCHYMANMNEEWKEGQTVGEYWHAH